VALSALAALSPSRAFGYSDWLAVGMAMHSVDQSDAMLGEWDRWSAQAAEKYEVGACGRKWVSFRGRSLGLGSLLFCARQDGWSPAGRNGSKSAPSANDAAAQDKRPEIVLSTQEHQVNEQAARALAADLTLYQRGHQLARILRGQKPEQGI